jgi:hypothetical protein
VRSRSVEILSGACQLTEFAQDAGTIDLVIRAAEGGGLVQTMERFPEPSGAASRYAALQDRLDFFVRRHLHDCRLGSPRLRYLRR